jgi:hypothetical protein
MKRFEATYKYTKALGRLQSDEEACVATTTEQG